MKSIIVIIGIVFSGHLFGQADTLNKVDEAGEKTGWWIICLDDDLKQLKDSVGATHCRYTFYTGKFDHYNMGTIGSKKRPVQFPESDNLMLGNYKLLNGDYISHHKNGEVRFILSASNGILTEYKEFYDNGQLKTHFVYSNECGAPWRLCIKQYSEEGSLTFDGYNQIPQDRE